jgi:hypothetical protein
MMVARPRYDLQKITVDAVRQLTGSGNAFVQTPDRFSVRRNSKMVFSKIADTVAKWSTAQLPRG